MAKMGYYWPQKQLKTNMTAIHETAYPRLKPHSTPVPLLPKPVYQDA
jgi:hypothetical protein